MLLVQVVNLVLGLSLQDQTWGWPALQSHTGILAALGDNCQVVLLGGLRTPRAMQREPQKPQSLTTKIIIFVGTLRSQGTTHLQKDIMELEKEGVMHVNFQSEQRTLMGERKNASGPHPHPMTHMHRNTHTHTVLVLFLWRTLTNTLPTQGFQHKSTKVYVLLCLVPKVGERGWDGKI